MVHILARIHQNCLIASKIYYKLKFFQATGLLLVNIAYLGMVYPESTHSPIYVYFHHGGCKFFLCLSVCIPPAGDIKIISNVSLEKKMGDGADMLGREEICSDDVDLHGYTHTAWK